MLDVRPHQQNQFLFHHDSIRHNFMSVGGVVLIPGLRGLKFVVAYNTQLRSKGKKPRAVKLGG